MFQGFARRISVRIFAEKWKTESQASLKETPRIKVAVPKLSNLGPELPTLSDPGHDSKLLDWRLDKIREHLSSKMNISVDIGSNADRNGGPSWLQLLEGTSTWLLLLDSRGRTRKFKTSYSTVPPTSKRTENSNTLKEAANFTFSFPLQVEEVMSSGNFLEKS